MCIVDALGHGPRAQPVALAALRFVARHLGLPLPALFADCDAALRHSRGVAMGIAAITHDPGTLTYAGVGNTRALVAGARETRLSGSPGIVGGGYRRLVPECVPFTAGDCVVLSTDGLREPVSLGPYPRSLVGDPQRLAEALLDDWGRATDDAAVLVYQQGVD